MPWKKEDDKCANMDGTNYGLNVKIRGKKYLDYILPHLNTEENRKVFIELCEHYNYITLACQECQFAYSYVKGFYKKIPGFKEAVQAAVKDGDEMFVEVGYDNVRGGVLEGLEHVLSVPVEERDHDLFFRYADVFNRMLYFKEMVAAQKQMSEDAPPLELDLGKLSKEQRDSLLVWKAEPKPVKDLETAKALKRKRLAKAKDEQEKVIEGEIL